MPRKLLLVEGDQDSSEVLESLLQEQGYVVETCNDASAVVSRAVAAQPELILLDLDITHADADPFSGPKFDALNIMGWLPRMMEEGKVPPIIVTTSRDKVSKWQALEAGATAFLKKPVSAEKLLTAIHVALEEF